MTKIYIFRPCSHSRDDSRSRRTRSRRGGSYDSYDDRTYVTATGKSETSGDYSTYRTRSRR